MQALDRYFELCQAIGTKAKLMIVSKTRTVEEIRPFLEAGHRLFGENRVQEAKEKWLPLLEEYPDIDLHMIGGLQTNKLKEALSVFSSIDSIDRPELAEKFKDKDISNKSFMIEVNTGSEPQKSGIYPDKAEDFIKQCITEFHLPIVGLMCVPPHNEEPSPHFAFLKKLASKYDLQELSMGMSEDYKIALQQGSTMIRIGTALFGKRKY